MNGHIKRFFGDIDEKTIDQIRQISHIKKLKKEEILFYEGDNCKNLNLLIAGMIAVFRVNDKGSRFVLRYFEPLCMIAEIAAIEHTPYPASAVAEMPSTVLEIDYDKFQKIIAKSEKYSSIKQVLDNSIMGKLRYHVLESIFNPLNEKSTVGKVAHLLLENIDHFNDMKRWKIAEQLRIAPETLSRTLKKLEDEGLIRNENAKIEILKPTLLEAYTK